MTRPLRRRRQVKGATDRVVVVGAGLAGLSAAMRLAGAGREVTLLEAGSVPGGRAGLLQLEAPDGGGTYRIDPGPTVLTMPGLIEDCFDAVGERMSDWLELRRVEPAYRAHFADGSQLDLHTDVDAMTTEIGAVCGGANAAGFRRYVDFVTRLYRWEMRSFIDRNIDSPLDLVRPDLARLAAAGGFRRLAPVLASYLPDERLQRVFGFQAMYAGLSPYEALAIYAVISYMDSVAGVWFPRGGMHAVPEAMAAAAEANGVKIRYDTRVVEVERQGQRAVAVRTADGERITTDAVVLTPDLPVAYRELLGQVPRRVRGQRYSPSCWLMLAGSTRRYDGAVHHEIHFGQAWRSTFEEILGGRLQRDPSLLVSTPTITDPGLAPAGRAVYYVLVPTPNLDSPVDWQRVAGPYREHVLELLAARGYDGFSEAIEVESVRTPLDWAAEGMEMGTPFAAAHTFGQTGPFRPANLVGENIVFAGSGTVPGVGVPMVLVSGRLAAERITGPDPTYRSRAWL
jgi:phytoene desaturase